MSPKYKPCVHSSKRERKKSILYLLQRCPAVPWPPDLVATTAPRYAAPTFPPPFFLHPRERARGQTRTRTHSHPSSIKLYARNIFPAWECERKSNFNRAGISFRPEENAISLINIGKGRERATIKRIRRVSTDILGGLGRIKRKRRIRRREAERRKRGSGGFSGHRFVGRTRGRAASSKLSSSSSSSR